MTTTATTAHSGTAGASPSFYAPPSRRLHFFVRATDSKTIAMHAAADDTVAAVLAHLTGRGYGRDLRLLHAGRQLEPEATVSSLGLPPDSTLQLAARLRSTPHPKAWQLASHIAATAASRDAGTATATANTLEDLVKEYIVWRDLGSQHNRSDRRAKGAEEYLDIFLQSGAAIALVQLYLSDFSSSRFYAERAIRCFLSTDPATLPPNVMLVTAPVLLEFCRLLSLKKNPHEPTLTVVPDLLDVIHRKGAFREAELFEKLDRLLLADIVPLVDLGTGAVALDKLGRHFGEVGIS